MNIIGINAFHGDSSACLVRDGKLIAAAEEERFRRVKHWAGFPSEAIRYCLEEGGLQLADVDVLALNQDSRANLGRKLAYAVLRRPDVGLILERLRNRRRRSGVAEHLAEAFPGQSFRGEVVAVEHHLAHLASAFWASGLAEAAAVSVDGFGDFASAAWGVGRMSGIEVGGKVYFPHSLGIFYQALTQYLGFPSYGDEYKVMGLAAYGKPVFADEMRRIVRLKDDGRFELGLEFFRHHRERIPYEWRDGAPQVGTLYSPTLENLLGPARGTEDELLQRHRDIASSVQVMYEEAFFHLLERLHMRTGLSAVAVAGGCGMNSVANGKIRRRTPFQRVYIQPAAGDAGGAIGAALEAWRLKTGAVPSAPMTHAYWGPSYDDRTIGQLLEGSRRPLEGCRIERIEDEGALCSRTAEAILDGRVVGWFQGRMEWGPRALGNRSILADPRRSDMKEILNRKIKRRESFRPFAPSVLREAVGDWFEEDDDVPFMMKVFQIRYERRAAIPAVTHVDGSGRLQTVSRETNPRYYRLIESFRERTGIPMILNTSFNENEPVVCQPQEALDCFLRTRMDLLVMGNWWVERATGPAA